MWKLLFWLLLIPFLISCNQAGSLPNSANWELEGYILSVNENSVMLSDFKNGLVSVSQFDEHVEVGDRVTVKIDALMESYPYQAFSKGVKIIEPILPAGAIISEQEAVQIAYEHALSLGVENRDMVDYITIRKEASYQDDLEQWHVTLETQATGEFVVEVDAMDGSALVNDEPESSYLSNSEMWALEGYVLSVSNNGYGAMVMDFKGGLISISHLDDPVEVGDRIKVNYDEIRESYPAQTSSTAMKVVDPHLPAEVSISEKEAVQIAYEHIVSLNIEDKRFISFMGILEEAIFQDDSKQWQITIGTGEKRKYVVKVDAMDGSVFVDGEEIATQVSIKNVTNTGGNLYKDQLQDTATVMEVKVMIDSAERLDGIINYSPKLLIKMKEPDGETNTYHINIGEALSEGLIVDLADDESAYTLDEQAPNALRELLITNKD